MTTEQKQDRTPADILKNIAPVELSPFFIKQMQENEALSKKLNSVEGWFLREGFMTINTSKNVF